MTRRTIPKLKRLFGEIIAEANSNPAFAQRLAALFEDQVAPSAQRRTGTSRRAPGALDPYVVMNESGSAGLDAALKALDVDQLKDIIAEHGMDPAKLAMKWRKSDRLVEHIMSFVTSRERKGDAFRGSGDERAAESGTTEEPPDSG